METILTPLNSFSDLILQGVISKFSGEVEVIPVFGQVEIIRLFWFHWPFELAPGESGFAIHFLGSKTNRALVLQRLAGHIFQKVVLRVKDVV